ncbi:MAG: M14 family zinc carboxypeptidase [Candidatus Aminicenantaceae bacterium]
MFFKKIIKRSVIIGFLSFLPFSLTAENIKTPAEEVNYTSYTQYEEVSQFLSHIDNISDEMHVKIIGRTLETREYPSKDIYLCIINKEKAESPIGIDRSKPTFFIIASQHGNEQSAKEAALLFIRDLTTGELNNLLDEINFLIIPQANPYGNYFDNRRNEQNLDMNRDHIKLETPGVRSIHHVFRRWMPEVTIDVHEKGNDYYKVSIGCVSNINISPCFQKNSREHILADIEKKLKQKNITFYEYLITQRMGIDSSAGVEYKSEDLVLEKYMKRYSTTDLNDGRNSLGIYETFSFIQEIASQHDLKTLKERSYWQYYGIKFMAESIVSHKDTILSQVRKKRKNLIDKAKTFSKEDVVHLRLKYARDKNEPELVIKKYERSDTPILGIINKDKKAGDPLTRDDISSYTHPSEYKVVEETVQNWFPSVESIKSRPIPLGYIIPSEYQNVIETLLQHDIKVNLFTKDCTVNVESYTIEEIVEAEYDYLPPQKIGVEKNKHSTIIKKGDFYIPCAQPGAHLISCLLEPESQYGLIRYWKFELVPEKDDIFPFYRYTESEKLPLLPYKNWER